MTPAQAMLFADRATVDKVMLCETPSVGEWGRRGLGRDESAKPCQPIVLTLSDSDSVALC